ncbi:MAG: MMPL family transporter [Gemmataceae bacterium]
MFTLLGRVVARFAWLICLSWLVAGVVLWWLAPAWDSRTQDDDIHFLPARCASVRGYRLLQEAFPQEVFASRLILVVERQESPLEASDLNLVDEVVTRIHRLRDERPDLKILKVYSHRDAFIGKRLLSDDGHCTLVQIALDTPYLALHTRQAVDEVESAVKEELTRAGSQAPRVYFSGPAGVGRDLLTAGGRSLDNTTLATVILVLVILLLVYRSPLLALVPLVSIAIAVWVALSVLALLTLIPGFHLVNVSQIFAVVMLYGAGTDYCLFLVSRYREGLVEGQERTQALMGAISGVGGALAASAATVICGMALMATAEFAKVRSGGPAIAVSLTFALLASLTLTPALLRILGKAVFWPGRVLVRSSVDQAQGLWEKLSHALVRRPLVWSSVAAGLLLPLGLMGLQVRASYRATAELSSTSSSVLGLRAISQHFTAGELGPITILLESSRPWDTREGRQHLEHLAVECSALPHVAEIRCLTHPLGGPIDQPPPPPSQTQRNLRGSLFTMVWKMTTDNISEQIHRQATGFYVATLPGEPPRHVTRLDVVLHTDPFDPRSADTLRQLHRLLQERLPRLSDGPDLRAETYGVTVSATDLAEVTESDRRRINLLVLGGIFAILFLLVRNLLLAVYLLGTVLLSYYATLGATMLLAHAWHGRPWGEIDWRVPFFLFTILVAVGEDYNILLITRALEERKRHGGVEGTRRALAQTGSTITSCGLIMAGTFATLMLAGLNTMVQIGFALAFGVLLDTFLVRPILVPAFTLWLWRKEQTAAPTHEALRAAG